MSSTFSPRKVHLVGSRIRELRKRRRLTQTELSEKIGVAQSDLSRMEQGEYKVGLDTLFKILQVFDLKMSEFFGETEEPSAEEERQLLAAFQALPEGSRREVLDFARFKHYTRAIFSGLPTVVFATVVRDVVISRPDLSGLYHVGAKPIAKFDLLKLIANVYGKSIDIVPEDKLVLDRSLDATRFQAATGYVAPEWPELIRLMHAYK